MTDTPKPTPAPNVESGADLAKRMGVDAGTGVALGEWPTPPAPSPVSQDFLDSLAAWAIKFRWGHRKTLEARNDGLSRVKNKLEIWRVTGQDGPRRREIRSILETAMVEGVDIDFCAARGPGKGDGFFELELPLADGLAARLRALGATFEMGSAEEVPAWHVRV